MCVTFTNAVTTNHSKAARGLSRSPVCVFCFDNLVFAPFVFILSIFYLFFILLTGFIFSKQLKGHSLFSFLQLSVKLCYNFFMLAVSNT